MTDTKKPFLDFYNENSVIPTNLEIPNIKQFFNQRNFLFETLGIPTHFLRGANVLELGPGTGQKALHLLSLEPATYTAIDGNLESVRATKRVIKQSGFTGTSKVISSNFLDFVDNCQYDLSIAELVIPTQLEPEKFLQKLLNLTHNQGILIFTCCDPIGILSETIRKAITLNQKLVDGNLIKSAIRISKFFETDLDNLEGMTRIRTDWAIDQIIQPWIGPLLSIPQAISHLKSRAKFHESSPRFVEDYRWYKSPEISVETINNNVIKNYWEKCHNFVDTRALKSTRDVGSNKALFASCQKLYTEVYQSKWNKDSHAKVLEITTGLIEVMVSLDQVTVASIKSFLNYWQTGETKLLKDFRPWWGRGTQYLSVVNFDSKQQQTLRPSK